MKIFLSWPNIFTMHQTLKNNNKLKKEIFFKNILLGNKRPQFR